MSVCVVVFVVVVFWGDVVMMYRIYMLDVVFFCEDQKRQNRKALLEAISVYIKNIIRLLINAFRS